MGMNEREAEPKRGRLGEKDRNHPRDIVLETRKQRERNTERQKETAV